jgi:hypothetical protein
MEVDDYIYQNQCSIQVDKQEIKPKIKQKQDLQLSNDNMCTLFCTIEIIYLYFLNNRQKSYNDYVFSYYDVNNFKNQKSIEEMLQQLKIQTHLFKLSYKIYIQENESDYQFPNNLEKEKVIQFLNEWANIECLKPYCNEIVNLLQINCNTLKISNTNDEYNKKNYLTFNNLKISTKDENFHIEAPTKRRTYSLKTKKVKKDYNLPLHCLYNVIPVVASQINAKVDNIEKEIIDNGDYEINIKLNETNNKNIIKEQIDMFTGSNGKNNKEILENLNKRDERTTNTEIFL